MLPVLARLLEFSPQELARLRDRAAAAQPSTVASTAASLFSGLKLPGL